MSKTKRSWTFLLALAMLLSLCACGKQESEEQPELVVIGQPQVSSQTEPGYMTAELPMPEGYQDFGGLQSQGNNLYLHAETSDGGFAVLRYDTLTGEWKSWAINTGEANKMNAILGEGRVIVTDVPGTTRDTVEETAQVSGVPIILIDTAGLRETEDKVEKIGIERTAQAVAGADIVILVLDGSQAFGEEDDKVLQFIEKMNTDNLIVVINKEDLGVNISEDEVLSKMPGATVITTSLLGTAAGDAARKISETIGDLLDLGSINVRETSIITNERHIQMLRNADMNLDEAISMLQNGEPIEVAELSAHYAYDSLGKILGEEVGEEVLNRVFSKFCLGK